MKVTLQISDHFNGSTKDGGKTVARLSVCGISSHSNADGQADTQPPEEKGKMTGPNSDFEFVGEPASESVATSGSGPPKFEVDFNQQGLESRTDAGASAQVPQQPDDTGEDITRDGYDTETDQQDAADRVAAEIGSSSDEFMEDDSQESGELQAELEGESRRLPERDWATQRIMSQPVGAKKPQQNIVYGKLSVMVTEVMEEALLLPLRSPALTDLLENRHAFRAVAIRCGCELVFTRRVVVKRMVQWVRYVVLLLRGPSDAALKRFRAKLEVANVAFLHAVPYDAEKPRPRLLTSEHLPDNLDMAVCAERTGRSTAAWERLPLEMPQRRHGKPLVGKAKNLILPNNHTIEPVLSYVYPKWGFQSSKPIPHTQTFQSAVETAEELEKQQGKELRKA